MLQAYALMLMVSGGLLVALGSALSGQRRGSRIINLLAGVAFFGYGFYLEFLFSGGHYFIFFYAFIVPILLIVNTFKARAAARQAAQQQAAQQAYGQQAPYGSPQQGQAPSGPSAP